MARPVRCIETREVFRSYADAARAHGIDGAEIRRAAVMKKRAGGFTWEFAYTVDREAIRAQQRRQSTALPPVPVECEDGRIFPSTWHAARAIGVSTETLRAAMRDHRPCKDLYWRWIPRATNSRNR